MGLELKFLNFNKINTQIVKLKKAKGEKEDLLK